MKRFVLAMAVIVLFYGCQKKVYVEGPASRVDPGEIGTVILYSQDGKELQRFSGKITQISHSSDPGFAFRVNDGPRNMISGTYVVTTYRKDF